MEFKEKIRKQKKADAEIYYQAVKSMNALIDSPEQGGGYREANFAKGHDWLLVKQLFDYFHINSNLSETEDTALPEMLEAAGVHSRNVLLEKDFWREDAIPLLCRRKRDGEDILLLPAAGGGFFYWGRDGRRVFVTGKYSEEFEPEAICFYPTFDAPSYQKSSFCLSVFRRLSPWDIGMILFMSLAVTALGLISPLINRFIYDAVIPSGKRDGILPVMALLFGTVMTTGVFALLKNIWIFRVGDKGRNWTEAAMWGKALRMHADFYKEYEAGDLTGRIFMVSRMVSLFLEDLVPELLALLFSVVYLLQINSLSKGLLGPTCLIVLAVMLLLFVNSFLLAQANRRKNEAAASISGFLYQVYSGIRKVRLCGAESRVFARWAQMLERRERERFRRPFLVKYRGALLKLIMLGGTLLIYETVFSNELPASVYISYEIAFGNLMAAVFLLGNISEQIAYLLPAYEMAEPLLGKESEDKKGCVRVDRLGGKIELSNVCFRYQPEAEDVLKNLNLFIRPGEYVAITGPSGCGKSTMLRLLLGFENAQKGAVYYDDRDLTMLDMRSVRRHIGTVLQDGKLFDGDIFSNIALCRPDLTMDEAWQAAELAGIADDIRGFPMGMFTMVSEAGGGISGGQKQRILIARVFAMQPDIFFFDEATSALDNLTQKTVTSALDQMKGTRIVIAHRLSTIQNCDRILYFEKGAVAEEGTFEELMALNGGFAGLAKRQLI